MDHYPAPSHTQVFELEIKRSRFISTFCFCEDRAQAKQKIAEIAAKYPDASHNCWAFVAGTPDAYDGMDQSDDGEPKGTAGKPMLNVLQHSGLGNCLVVVSRYFGGIKLGVGGLVRAYTQAVSAALPMLKTELQLLRAPLQISIDYSQLARLEYWLSELGIVIIDKLFDSEVTLTLSIPQTQMPTIERDLILQTNAKVRIIKAKT